MSGGSLLRWAQPEPHVSVAVGGREFIATRVRLGGFLRLQEGMETLAKAGKSQENQAIADALFSILGPALDMDRLTFETASWLDVFRAYLAVVTLNTIPEADRMAIVRFAEKGKPVPWDYQGRASIAWVHLFAEAYGWTKDQVLELWPEEAIGLMQEIEASDFSRREFQHVHSELAWTFDKRGKGTYKPLKKPAWMVFRQSRLLTRLLRKSLPLGDVRYDDGLGPEVKEQKP